MELSQLDKSRQKILAYVKSNVLLQLLEIVSEYDDEAKKLTEKKSYSFQISAAGGPTRYICVKDGKLTAYPNRKFWPSISLWFPSSKAMNKLFNGDKTFVLPVPRGFRILSLIKNFNALMDRLKYYMKGGPEVAKANIDFMAKLLLYSSIFGISQVANNDSYVSADVSHIKDGVIEAYIRGKEDISAHIIKKDGVFTTYRGRAPERANVQMIFRNEQVALDVLTGKMNATVAMALNDIEVKGSVNMVKNVLPILDRLAWYFSIK